MSQECCQPDELVQRRHVRVCEDAAEDDPIIRDPTANRINLSVATA